MQTQTALRPARPFSAIRKIPAASVDLQAEYARVPFANVGMAMNKNLIIRSGNRNHQKCVSKLVDMIQNETLDPRLILTKQESLMSMLDAYEAFNARKPGWIKVELLPTVLKGSNTNFGAGQRLRHAGYGGAAKRGGRAQRRQKVMILAGRGALGATSVLLQTADRPGENGAAVMAFEAQASRVLERRFGKPPTKLERETGGKTNIVFAAEYSGGDAYIVRMQPDPKGSANTYRKEKWASERVRTGIPAPEVLAVSGGTAETGDADIPLPYMISRKAEGNEATGQTGRREREQTLKQLGALGGRINTLPTTGFGEIFDWADAVQPRLRHWNAFLQVELKLDDRLNIDAARDAAAGGR